MKHAYFDPIREFVAKQEAEKEILLNEKDWFGITIKRKIMR